MENPEPFCFQTSYEIHNLSVSMPQTKDRTTDSNPQSKETKENRKPLPHCFQPPVEGGRKADCILYWFQAQSKGTTCCPTGPNRKAQHAVPPCPVERHSLTAFNLQSKKATRQNQKASPYTDFQAPVEGYNLLLPLPNRRTGPRPCQGPIERRDFAVASPNRRRPTECKSKAASPQSKDTHFSYFYLIFSFILSMHFNMVVIV